MKMVITVVVDESLLKECIREVRAIPNQKVIHLAENWEAQR